MKTRQSTIAIFGHLGKEKRRGVSPIIATILLVAITVVLAAVLYVLVTQYLVAPNPSPKTILLSGPSPETTGTAKTCHTGSIAASQYVVSFGSYQTSSGLATDSVGLKLVGLNGATLALTGACLYNATGTALAWYSSGAWDANIVFPNGGSMAFAIGTASLTGSDDTIQAYGLGSASVSGGYSSGL